ncbi:class I glutamine amidotransferase-like protein [Xylaria sp. CBS 124048]|nr:class I glutamine amidotransferase-like protein [Xylaria sp. CBS 124048]
MNSHSAARSPREVVPIAGGVSPMISPGVSSATNGSPSQIPDDKPPHLVPGRVARRPETTPEAAKETGPLRIAILLNSCRSHILPAIRLSYQRTIGAVAPDAQLAFYEPANRPGDFPNPDYFDLIVLGGGNVDPRKRHPWILEVHDFVRRLVRVYPHKKLLGICWGHQTICSVFGGTVVDAAVPEMGVLSVNLTSCGREFFHEVAPLKSFMLQQHHRREVAIAPQGFSLLAIRNQCLINETNTILTFQGHPEKDTETARLRLHDSTRWFGFDALSDEKAWAQLQELVSAPHDGEMVWRRIFEWVREPFANRGEASQGAMLESPSEENGSKI